MSRPYIAHAAPPVPPPVVVPDFKTDGHYIRDFPNLSNYVRELYSIDAFRKATNITHIKVCEVRGAPSQGGGSIHRLPSWCTGVFEHPCQV
jgi:hypothetical protein